MMKIEYNIKRKDVLNLVILFVSDSIYKNQRQTKSHEEASRISNKIIENKPVWFVQEVNNYPMHPKRGDYQLSVNALKHIIKLQL